MGNEQEWGGGQKEINSMWKVKGDALTSKKNEKEKSTTVSPLPMSVNTEPSSKAQDISAVAPKNQ